MLALDAGVGIDICVLRMAIVALRLIDIALVLLHISRWETKSTDGYKAESEGEGVA